MSDMSLEEAEEFSLGASAVARVFGVDPKTVSRWADDGKIPYRRTLGKHRRFRERDIKTLLEDDSRPPTAWAGSVSPR